MRRFHHHFGMAQNKTKVVPFSSEQAYFRSFQTLLLNNME
jgi:hypothetical protein